MIQASPSGGKIPTADYPGPVPLNLDLHYRAADLAAYFEIQPDIAERIERHLMARRAGGIERAGGIKIGGHVLVMVTPYMQAYGFVTAIVEREQQNGGGR